MAELVADYFLKRLREWGVHRIYGYPGDGINALPRRARPRRRRPRASSRPATRRWPPSWRAATRSSPATRRRLHGDLGPGRDPPAQRPLRREARPRRRCVAIVGPAEALLARLALPAGGRPPGRCSRTSSRVRPGRAWSRRRRATSSTAPAGSRSTAAASARSSSRTTSPSWSAVESPPRDARLRLLERRLHAAARRAAAGADIAARGRDPQRGREGRDPRRPGRARRRRGARARSPTCSAPGVAKALLGKDVLADDLPYVTGAIGLLGTIPSYEHDGGLRHAAHGRHELPVRGVPARRRARRAASRSTSTPT